MKIKNTLLLAVVAVMVLTSCAGQTPAVPTDLPPATPIEPRAIVIGDISDDPAEVIEGAQPLADYLASQLSEFGITEGKVRVASSIEEMAELLAKGEVDLYFDSIYPATLISDQTGAQIVLRRWRFGVDEYQGVIFTSASSGITSLEQLPGHMVAMDAPYSTSGFLLPSVLLLEKGFTLSGKERYDDPVAPGEIGFAFSYDDENTLQWVLNGFTAAGVTDDFHFDVAFPEEAKSQLVELARTEFTPRQVALIRSGLGEELVQAIVRALTTMHETEAGAAALEPFQTSRFDEFPEGIESATARMREMMELVNAIRLP
ncbi:MAG: phosphate/phosphite/phosphonate ABC transporter substrate-binding protein [Chloroflexi bacterium]|nr:phosphate/phosphite/phosphonate ABC transporter substrate-binding protein [Chloroflexota bacterium]